MKKLSVAMMVVLAAGWAAPVSAQMPNINLLADGPSKSQEEKDADAARDKAYKETLKKIPNAQTSSDPWGGVRAADAPKTPPVKTTSSAKKSKSSTSAN
jgi:hypothetical protein